MKSLIWIATGVISLIALSFAWFGLRSTQASKAALSSLEQTRAALGTDIAAVEDRILVAAKDEEKLVAAQKEYQAKMDLQDAAAREKKNAEALAAQNRNGAERAKLAALMEANPELRSLFRKSFQANLSLVYLPFFDQLKLTSEQIQKFKDTLTENEEDRMDFQATIHKQGLTQNDPAVVKTRADLDEKLKTAQVAILGDAGYAQFKDYKRSEPTIGFIDQVSNLASSVSAPLSAQQAEQMMRTLTSASSKYQSGANADMLTVDWPRAISEARSYLNPAQLALMKANAANMQTGVLLSQFYQAK